MGSCYAKQPKQLRQPYVPFVMPLIRSSSFVLSTGPIVTCHAMSSFLQIEDMVLSLFEFLSVHEVCEFVLNTSKSLRFELIVCLTSFIHLPMDSGYKLWTVQLNQHWVRCPTCQYRSSRPDCHYHLTPNHRFVNPFTKQVVYEDGFHSNFWQLFFQDQQVSLDDVLMLEVVTLDKELLTGEDAKYIAIQKYNEARSTRYHLLTMVSVQLPRMERSSWQSYYSSSFDSNLYYPSIFSWTDSVIEYARNYRNRYYNSNRIERRPRSYLDTLSLQRRTQSFYRIRNKRTFRREKHTHNYKCLVR